MPHVFDPRPTADTAAQLEWLQASSVALRDDIVRAFASYGVNPEDFAHDLQDTAYFIPAAEELTALYAGICVRIDHLPFFERAFLCLGLYRSTLLPDHPNLLQRDTLGALYEFAQSLASTTDMMAREEDTAALRRCFYAAAHDWTEKAISVCLRRDDSSLYESEFAAHVAPLTPEDVTALSDSGKRLRDVFALADAPLKAALNAALADAARDDPHMPAHDIDTLMQRLQGNDLREGLTVGGYFAQAAKAPWPGHAGAVILRLG